MAYGAKIIADSIGPNGVRLTTFEVDMWRPMLAEANTHKLFTRNSASSRAIPTSKILAKPTAFPIFWGKNQPGMSSAEELSPEDIEVTKREWEELADITRSYVKRWNERGLAKAVANRPLEWFGNHIAIISATEYDGFLRLRAPADGPPDPNFPAQMEFQAFSTVMRDLLRTSNPRILAEGEWHLPYVTYDDKVIADRNYGIVGSAADIQMQLCKISTGRLARVSYLTHDGRRDHGEDIKLHDKLLESQHMSPFEHVAQARSDMSWSGNFRGWTQYRSLVDKHFVWVGR